MEAGIVALLTTIGAIALALLKLYTGPSSKERQNRKEKGEIDDAIRKKDYEDAAALLNHYRDNLSRKLHEDKDHPRQQTD